MEHFNKILAAIVVLFLAFGDANAVTFSWLPNAESNLSRYEIYCDPKPSEQLGESSHSMWKHCDKDNIIDDRVHCTWDDFPGTLHYCVVVAVDVDGNVSDYSNEVAVHQDFVNPRTLPIPGNFHAATVE